MACCVLACSPDEAPLDARLAAAREQVAAGRHAEAVSALQALVAEAPERADLRLALAESYRARGLDEQELRELEEATRLDPENGSARLQYARASVRSSGEAARLRVLERARSRVDEAPGDAAAHLDLGRALRAVDRTADARDAFAEAARLAPGDAEAHRQLGYTSAALGEREAALSAYERAVELDGSFASWISLGQLLAQDGDRDEDAVAAFRAAAKAGSESQAARAIEAAAGLRAIREGPETGASQLEAAYERLQRPPVLLPALARFLVRADREADALARLREAAEERPGDAAPQIALATFLSDRGDLDGASAALARARTLDPEDPEARLREAFLVGELGRRDGDPAEVARGRALVEEVIADDPANAARAYLLLARLQLSDGEAVAATESVEIALALGLDSASVHALHGAALLRSAPERAEAALRRSLARDPASAEVRVLLVGVYNRLGRYEEAWAVGAPVLAKRPAQSALRLDLSRSLVGMGKLLEASQVLQLGPEKRADLYVALAGVQIQREKWLAARRALERASRLAPDDPTVLEAWLPLDAREERIQDSRERIAAAIGARPQDGTLQWLAARAAGFAGDLPGAERHLRRAVDLAPGDPRAHRDLVQLHVLRGDLDLAIAKREGETPVTAGRRLLLGFLLERSGRFELAIRAFRDALARDPSLAIGKRALAYRLAEAQQDLDGALALAGDAKQALREDPGAAETLGWVHFRRGEFGPAVDYLREAVAGASPGQPERARAQYHLAVAEEAAGERAAAARTIRSVLELLSRQEAAGAAQPAWGPAARETAARLQAAAAALGPVDPS